MLRNCPDCGWPLIEKRWYMGREWVLMCISCYEFVGPKEKIKPLRLVVSN